MTRQFAATLAALVVFLWVVALVTFLHDFANVGACGVGPAAKTGVACAESR